mgnify:CR=1 FL=1
MKELKIDKNSKLLNVKLMDLPGIVKCRVLICAVLRGGASISPKGDFVMNGGSIYNNRSGLRGGGICVTEGMPLMHSSTISIVSSIAVGRS